MATEATSRLGTVLREFVSLEIYKRGQGQRMRWLTTGGIALLALWCSLSIYWELEASRPDGWTPAQWVWVVHCVPLAVFGIIMWITFRIVWGWPRFGEFLIATEAEMNKVSWAKWDQIRQATIVVLIVVVLMASYFYIVDVIWSYLLQKLGVLQMGGQQAAAPWQGAAEVLATLGDWLRCPFG
jgi:preprotein translocase subunit SecE